MSLKDLVMSFVHQGETVGVYKEGDVFYYKTAGRFKLFGTGAKNRVDAASDARSAIDRAEQLTQREINDMLTADYSDFEE